MTSNRTRPTGRRMRAALALACAGALATAALAAAGPVAAGVPSKAGKADSTSTAASSPNKDDDAIKDPCEALNYTDHSAANGSTKESDEPSQCGSAPPPPGPAPVVAVQAATVAPETDLLACGETITTDGKGIQPDVAVSRLVDADKALASECDAFPYELKSTPDGLRFIKPSGYPLAQFFVDVTWYRGLGEPDKSYSVDFEAVEGGYPIDMTDCPASVRDSETGEVVGLTDAKDLSPEEFAALGIVDQDGLPRVDDATDNGLTQFACIADTTEVFDAWADGGPRWQVLQRIWLLGDVRMRSY